ncbi:hypothetical protein S40285_05799 [Stachybotrys chlorohalonatus IBT 40285]|uniref:Aminotransferase class I/classII large domain-containing protein n=1 Tax=Stachybotrys chlorohalonatus (strain IBT 40285) TaxID=1283841 RepID=A0A084QF42_STAC4|nr:hypothetical protein S40285_05799 [Stachybotrys chlorohalonata IBT 40285]
MYAEQIIKQWGEDNRLRAASMTDEPAFYRNLEQALDTRRQAQYFLNGKPRWDDSVADFTTGDFLSLARTGKLREAFLQELADNPDFEPGPSGSRLQYGNYPYIVQTEQEIAEFHNAETALIVNSTYAANLGVLSSVPLPGDAIVYDELVHASSHEGFRLSSAEHLVPFRHNDPDGLREVLSQLKSEHAAFAAGTQSVLICVESVYSMDATIVALQELVQVAKEVFPLGNAQFIMDEAHSAGVLGDKGRGLVSLLGLEKDIAIRIHATSKALGSVGGVVMCNKTVRHMMLNHARSLTFSCAPSFPMVASMRASIKLLRSGATVEAQERIQSNVKRLLHGLTTHPVWDEANDEGIISMPTLEDWESRPFQTQIVPLRTRPRHELFLFYHLIMNNINAYPIAYPVVPKGKSRVRLVVHAHNTPEEVDRVIAAVCGWAEEMLEIERGESEHELPKAARQAYAMQRALQT